MDLRNVVRRQPPTSPVGVGHDEEMLAEVDEPPDERRAKLLFSPPISPLFDKAPPHLFQRRESLLTRQLHSEAEQTDDDQSRTGKCHRALSTQSTWSIASTAELTSDDGRSMPSPCVSPPLPPTTIPAAIPLVHELLTAEPKIVGQDEGNAVRPTQVSAETAIEAGLGRKRCISFACGGKDKPAPTPPPAPRPETDVTATSPKRKCSLRFVCPTRTAAAKSTPEVTTPTKRIPSPLALERKPSASKAAVAKAHRGSDSTITHPSPKNVRKSTAMLTTEPLGPTPTASRRFSNDDSDDGDAAVRFHEFASSDSEPEAWVQESTCHRSRLTVNDTLRKETILRKACEEVEEEAVEEEEAEEEDAELDDDEANDDNDQEDDSDDGFRTDDEEGFAESDSEAEDSDGGWWRPGALSTAATSVDHLERPCPRSKSETAPLPSSVGSASSNPRPLRSFISKPRHKPRSSGVAIEKPPAPVDLPDSTDFVCGTLDEDRPLEQAFINTMRQREAAKHKARPQDIDPTFPTSDPEMDEEDDDDLEDAEDSESEKFMHGELEELHGDLTARRRPSPRTRATHRSPPPPRRRSPAPVKRTATHSPPPPKRMLTRSPPPPKRMAARSPPPRKLFGHSPVRSGSPAPNNRRSSPPNTRRASPMSRAMPTPLGFDGLATRPQLTHTASLPRGGFMLSKLGNMNLDDADGSETIRTPNNELPKRGAIDIVKGLEKKRQRRKEKLYQKMCAKAAAKGDKAYKVKPGKGAERMREVGLELQRYHGRGEHILSM